MPKLCEARSCNEGGIGDNGLLQYSQSPRHHCLLPKVSTVAELLFR